MIEEVLSLRAGRNPASHYLLSDRLDIVQRSGRGRNALEYRYDPWDMGYPCTFTKAIMKWSET